MMRLANRINTGFDRWLTAPEPNAAGRMSLFRIVYGVFYLLTLPTLTSYTRLYGSLPAEEWRPVASIRWLNPPPPHPLLLQALPLVLVAALVLLIVGWQTRLATAGVLVAGVVLSAVYYGYYGILEHSDTFLVAYIPAVMLFSRWDRPYSIDALLRQRRGTPPVDPHDESWVYIWPLRALLLLLSFLFFGAGLVKLAGGYWLTRMDTLSSFLLDANVAAARTLRAPNPLNPALAGLPWLLIPLQFGAMLFELAFPLSLLNRRLRTFFVAGAVLMHTFILVFMHIEFYSLLIVYMLFVDWQAVLGRWLPAQSPLKQTPTPVLIAGSVALAALVTLLATQVSFAHLLPEYVLSGTAFVVALGCALWSGIAIVRHDLPNAAHWLKQRRTG